MDTIRSNEATRAALMARIKAGDLSAVPAYIAAFNSRPLDRRNHCGYMVRGWSLVEVDGSF
jgi:hypothetical protein